MGWMTILPADENTASGWSGVRTQWRSLAIPLDHIEVVIEGALDMTGVVGLPSAGPIKLEGLRYTPTATSAASAEQIEQLHQAVEQTCAVLNTLRSPMEVVRQG